MSKIFVVTSGCYSDYRIEGVFDSRESALVFMDYHQSDDIEEWDLNPEVLDMKGLNKWRIWIDREGTVEYHSGRVSNEFIEQCRVEHTNRNSEGIHIWKLMMIIWAKDLTHATKIANEKRAAYFAGSTHLDGYASIKGKSYQAVSGSFLDVQKLVEGD